MATQLSHSPHTVATPVPHHWTREQYEQMIEAGILDEDDHVELIEGEIVTMSPRKGPHSTAVMLLLDALRAAYPKGFIVRPQLPLALDPDSEPEPDIAVVSGQPRDYRDAHPTTAILLVEVADTTLAQDRTQKVRLYARHGIPEYWILNVVDECLEVYRNPAGDTYQTKITLRRGDTVAPPEGDSPVQVDDIIP